MAAASPKRPESGRYGPQRTTRQRAPNLPVLFHPDYNRRLRNRTESADPADCSAGARGLWQSLAITAGGDFHPAPRTRSDRNPTDPINAPLTEPCNAFRQLGCMGSAMAPAQRSARRPVDRREKCVTESTSARLERVGGVLAEPGLM